MTVLWGLLIPFLGTAAGAGCVFFLKKDLKLGVQRALTGFAAGVMVAASIWSLIVPAMEQSAAMGRWAFLPAFAGFWLGILFLLLLDHAIPHLHRRIDQAEGPKSSLSRMIMMVLAVTLHNIPEGMAVGLAFALAAQGRGTLLSASALALGVGLQNLPEGAAVSLPLRAAGMSCAKGFFLGVLSGAAEPAAGVAAALLASCVQGALPLLMAFAAGAMLLVTCSEMIPEAARSRLGLMAAAAGFALMMAMDVGLG